MSSIGRYGSEPITVATASASLEEPRASGEEMHTSSCLACGVLASFPNSILEYV